MEYKYVTMSIQKDGLLALKYEGHREIIEDMSKQGFKFAGYIPLKIVGYGVISKIDLVFIKEN